MIRQWNHYVSFSSFNVPLPFDLLGLSAKDTFFICPIQQAVHRTRRNLQKNRDLTIHLYKKIQQREEKDRHEKEMKSKYDIAQRRGHAEMQMRKSYSKDYDRIPGTNFMRVPNAKGKQLPPEINTLETQLNPVSGCIFAREFMSAISIVPVALFRFKFVARYPETSKPQQWKR